MRETCKKEDIKAFLTLKIKKYYTLWKMADSFVKNISALFLQGFEIGFKKTLERGKYMKKVFDDKTLGYDPSEHFQLPEGFDPCAGSEIGSEDSGELGLDDLFN